MLITPACGRIGTDGFYEELHSEGRACGHAGGAIVNIVTTEHLRFAEIGSADPNAMLFAALQDKQVCT